MIVATEDKSLPIPLSLGAVTIDTLLDAANTINRRLSSSGASSSSGIDIYAVIDLRMLSGVVGELFSTVMSETDARLVKNVNIDGYPDLCDISGLATTPTDLDAYINFPGGGIEVKNTFGVKKSGVSIRPRDSRVGKIQRILVWKAHHPFTNNLLALQSDYVDGIPQIVRGFFSSELTEEDWTVKQNPRVGSTMTSFCQTKTSAYVKLLAGERFRMKGYPLND